MKKFTKILTTVLLTVHIFLLPLCWQGGGLYAQCNAFITVDGNQIMADNPTNSAGLHLPIWLTAGQTLAAGANVNSIGVLTFTGTTSLTFAGSIKVTTVQTVPTGATWKVESILKKYSPYLNVTSPMTFTSSGIFVVPCSATTICIQVWGGGGGGGGSMYNSNWGGAGGGGGGGYGAQCFAVTPGASYTVTVGGSGGAGYSTAGGAGGTSSVSGTGVSISATGGGGGNSGGSSSPYTGGTAGTGGTSSATINSSGAAGVAGVTGSAANGGNGGYSGYAIAGFNGVGGTGSYNTGGNGGSYGGGGGGASGNAEGYGGGNGGNGAVIIGW